MLETCWGGDENGRIDWGVRAASLTAEWGINGRKVGLQVFEIVWDDVGRVSGRLWMSETAV